MTLADLFSRFKDLIQSSVRFTPSLMELHSSASVIEDGDDFGIFQLIEDVIEATDRTKEMRQLKHDKLIAHILQFRSDIPRRYGNR
jgi:hypothetical protein